MRIIGIDSSTSLGLALLDTETGVAQAKLIQQERTGFARAQLIAQSFAHTLDAWDPQFAVIEGFAFGNANTLAMLVEIATLLKREMAYRGIQWVMVQPSALKKWTTGKGGAKKPDMAAAVKARWGYEPQAKKKDDLVDAYALSRVGEALLLDKKAVPFTQDMLYPLTLVG